MKKIIYLAILMICIISCNLDKEYLGHYVTKIAYEEPWDEYVHQTCTRDVAIGTDGEGNTIYDTETYDCSYVDKHYPKWRMYLECGEVIPISEDQYNEIARKFKTKPIFIDMHRHYYRQDGDRYEIKFDGNRNRMWTNTMPHIYENKILKSKSVFNFSKVSKAEFNSLGLYDYPKDFNYFKDQNPIVCTPNIKIRPETIDSFQYLNAYYGGLYQFRCYVMIWMNKPLRISKKEQDFLVGGNKNELIVCMSISEKGKIQWVNSFSWEDKPYISVGVNHLYKTGEIFDLMKLNRYLLQEVPKKWKRKEFKDFDYL